MDILLNILQVAIALTILNVWLVRREKATPWRGGNARNMAEEFRVYGLARWVMIAVGIAKVSLAAMLLLGVWFPALTRPAALGLMILMLAAIAMHVKAGDPAEKAMPAATIFGLCIAAVAI